MTENTGETEQKTSDMHTDEDRVAQRVLICSPLLTAVRGRGHATVLGTLVFGAFFLLVVFVLVCSLFVLLSDLVLLWKVLVLVAFCLVLFSCLLLVLLIDVLSSVEDRISVAVEYLRRIEENGYNLFVLEGKRRGR